MMTIKPIFIFSLPRSGSTLLQRVLASHENISSVAEPWILLPVLSPLKPNGVYAEYSHTGVYSALQDFFAELPHGESDYLEALRNSILALYQEVSNESAIYFVDKTPRYHLICSKIIRMFPEGKFIFLWRNPLATIASIIETWGGGRWNIFKYKVDVFDGIRNLIEASEEYQEKIVAVQYEKLLIDPRNELKRIFNYLDLDFSPGIIHQFATVTFKGRFGDPAGVNTYKSISCKPLNKWKMTLRNPFRKIWCRKYLRWLDRERLEHMGYDMKELLKELNLVPTHKDKLLADIVMAGYGMIYCAAEPKMMKHKLETIFDWKWIKKHG